MKKAFTLIELLVVISIIGVLTTLILANLSDARGRARDAVKKSDFGELKTALRMYYNDHQAYPANQGIITGATFTPYMKKVPTTYPFIYTSPDASHDTFFLRVTLENASDSDLAASKLRCPGSGAATTEYVVCED
ncbi:MAG: prepilin-type N-terminal cleavage/methylation domain-containing protein [Candidatus Beckwithbacteria bacterium]|nr:prepilin-type N-terminal cleavage/methylation domain-containing protein [Candidatus Beckwithbacteria bacterium]